jgi:hypothetical protein
VLRKKVLVIGAASMIGLDAAVRGRVVHRIALDGVLAFLVLEDHFLLVDPARGLADAGIALEVEIAGLVGLGVLIGHVWLPFALTKANRAPVRGFRAP